MQAKVQLLVAIILTYVLNLKSISSQNVYGEKRIARRSVDLQFCSSPTTITASLRERIVLECSAVGEPYPTLYWLKDGVRMSRSNSSIFPQGASCIVSRLHINCVTKKRAAVYTCVVETPWGIETQNHTLFVDTRRTLTNLPKCSTQRRKGFPGRISMYTKEVTESLGQNARLYCRFNGIPLPNKTEWSDKHGNSLSSGIKYRLGTNGDLVIKNVSQHDVGCYTCKVTNDHGGETIHSSLKLFQYSNNENDENFQNELPTPISMTTTKKVTASKSGRDVGSIVNRAEGPTPTALQDIMNHRRTSCCEVTCKINVTDAPKSNSRYSPTKPLVFGGLYTNVTASLGEEKILKCEVKGQGNPTIYWLKNGLRISQSNSSIIPKCAYEKLPKYEFASIMSKLYLNCITEESAGIYTCVDETPLKRNYLNYTVNVDTNSSATNLRNCTSQSNIEFPARITMHTKDYEEYRNREVRLYCRFDGNPLPNRTSWLNPYLKPITSGVKYRISKNGDLIIKKFSDDDQGDYKCTVANQHGSESIITKLLIRKSDNL